MGNQPSSPQPGTKLQVIGAGLSRTGTASFSEALHILLQGPVYHGGTQACLGPPVEIKSLIKILDHFPPKTSSEKVLLLKLLKERYDGYAAVTDVPAYGLVEELLEVYPDAIVICTTRDPEAWVKSLGALQSAMTFAFLRFILFPVTGMRHFVTLVNGLTRQWIFRYGERPLDTRTYELHMEYLQRVVPKEKLVFFDVREGWGPLCKALGRPVPEGVPFPRINDAEAIERETKGMVVKGLVRWLVFFTTVGVGGLSWFLLK
ncbi:hypothetical protein P154DRAFT_527219 [Amniculicola lignicola CBS 123094]|uniref:NAD dependent epimerase/dehydratase n=1 Tax=Amniculicola lignicola CBS 123094 TaxID=1392246 RepID=A0A6A5VXC4_9PLEO|nr:hypothetical protein P154DRAFT_527219 [Amniculicola lignicola CBS 123094]